MCCIKGSAVMVIDSLSLSIGLNSSTILQICNIYKYQETIELEDSETGCPAAVRGIRLWIVCRCVCHGGVCR